MIIYYIAAAAAGLLVGMSLADRAYDYHLIHKANPSCRTGMFVRGKMYYIVTEREFVTKILGLEDVSRVDKPKRLTEILGKEGRAVATNMEG